MELKKYKLGEIGEIRMCKRILKSETNPYFGIPFYKIGTFGKIADAFIDPLLYKHYKKSYSFPRKGDVLISAAGTIGKSVIYNGEDAYFQDSNIVWIEHDQSIVLNEFLYYLLNSIQWIPSKGSTIFRLYNDDIRNKEVFLPSIKEQRGIVSVLSSIDRKIELNRTINQNLEAMAKLLYDYWFVQFDFPNEEGKPYKSSGGKMVWNEKIKREIPIDWEILPLFDAVSVQYGFPFATEQFTEEETDVPVVRIRDILEGTTSAYSLEKADEKYHLNENDVLVGMDGNFHMNFWHDNIAYLNQRCVRLRAHSDSTISSIQILHSIKPYIKAKEQNAKGSTVGHLSDKALKGLYLIKPLKTRVFNSRKTLDGLLALVIENKKQILSLTKQRDELLPLLMNGQVSPPNCD